MIYSIEYSDEAVKELKEFKKSGNKPLLKKISAIIKELEKHPTSGTGKPEQLKHQFTGLWSRRINREHRIIYEIQNDIVKVFILFRKRSLQIRKNANCSLSLTVDHRCPQTGCRGSVNRNSFIVVRAISYEI